MGICDSNKIEGMGEKHDSIIHANSQNKKEELFMGNIPVPMETANKLSKSICKITYINMSQKKINGTGFFMMYNSLKCLISVNHVITSNLIDKNIEIEIHNKKKFNLQLSSRFIKFFERPIDISVIEIKDSDGINEDIEYLNHDLNYNVKGYSIYKEMEVISLGYPFGKELIAGAGIIKNINGYEFEHNISTEQGSSGAPIILLNLKMVIGIHKYGDIIKKINVGTFIGKIFDVVNNNLNRDNNNENKNNIKMKKILLMKNIY